jgi:hypothetical protein
MVTMIANARIVFRNQIGLSNESKLVFATYIIISIFINLSSINFSVANEINDQIKNDIITKEIALFNKIVDTKKDYNDNINVIGRVVNTLAEAKKDLEQDKFENNVKLMLDFASVAAQVETGTALLNPKFADEIYGAVDNISEVISNIPADYEQRRGIFELKQIAKQKTERMQIQIRELRKQQSELVALKRKAIAAGLLPEGEGYDPVTDRFQITSPDRGIDFGSSRWRLTAELADGKQVADTELPGPIFNLEPDSKASTFAMLQGQVDGEGCQYESEGSFLEATLTSRCTIDGETKIFVERFRRVDDSTFEISSDHTAWGHSVAIFKKVP